MKIIKKTFFMIIIIVIIFQCVVDVSATTIEQDNLNISLITDKKNYAIEDSITTVLTIENTNDKPVKNVMIENIIPNGYELAKGYNFEKTVQEIKPSEKIEFKVVYNSSSTARNIILKDYIFKILVIVLGLVLVISIIFICMKKKRRKSLLSFFIFMLILGTVTTKSVIVYVAENDSKTVSITEKVFVGNVQKKLKANITFTFGNISSDSSEISNINGDSYFKQSAEIISVRKATDSKNILTEKEVSEVLSERGFNIEGLITNCTINGEYLEDTEIDSNSDEKHPLYKMVYGSENELLWTIYITDGTISAYPVSYNMVSEREAPLLITETDTVVSYDYTSNQFFETIPKESVVIIKKVDKIDKKTLDTITIGELKNL